MKHLKLFEDVDFDDFDWEEESENDDITKVDDYTYEDMVNFQKDGVLESFGNAHYFMVKFLNSSDDIRRNKNPHNIEYSRMESEFGEPNFRDSDYKGTCWWILDFQGKMFAVHIHEMVCSVIYQFLSDEKNHCYDKQFSIDAENFYNKFFDIKI